jgi:hypothetical protein
LGQGHARHFTRCFRLYIRDRLLFNFGLRRRAASLRDSLRYCSRGMFEGFDVLSPKSLGLIGKGLDEPDDLGIPLNWGRDNGADA